MTNPQNVEKCLAFINCQLKPADQHLDGHPHVTRAAVTISRQAGCGALEVAEKLAAYLQPHTQRDAPAWTVFDRNLVEKVLEDHNLPQRIGKFMPENWISEIEDTIDELFGLHPPAWILVRQTAETILRLARLGNVILIGRAANIITAKLEHVFHVRLVAPLEKRILQIQKTDRLDRAGAIELIHREDRGRKRYLKRYYKKDVGDPLLYDLTINTGMVRFDEAARIIGDAVIQRMSRQIEKPSPDEASEIIASKDAYLPESAVRG
jgi:cytidylate kinase-like protein